MNLLIKTVFISLFTLCFAVSTLAQEQTTGQQTPAKSICETMKGFNDFDFWLGEWDVYSNDEKRTPQGTNSITRHHQNCLIMENWTLKPTSGLYGSTACISKKTPINRLINQTPVKKPGFGFNIKAWVKPQSIRLTDICATGFLQS